MVFELLGELARLGAEVEPEAGEEVGGVPFLLELDAHAPVVLSHMGKLPQEGVSFGQPGIGGPMPTKNEVIVKQVAVIRQDLRDLWTALRTDPKEQKRKERMWAILLGVLRA